MNCITTVGCLLLVAAGANGKYFSLDQGIFVHMFEWRWEDIAQECEEFLAPNGYKGVQISPPQENLVNTQTNRPWWERYQPLSYQLITRSGDEDQLKDMIKRCNAVGVRVLADAVFNHMTGDWSTCVGTAGSTCDMSTLDYPGVPYTQEHFHYPECDISNYNDASNVKNCKLVSLHDLNQTTDYVRTKVITYLNSLIDIGVAGFRIDAAKHQWPSDLEYIFSQLHNLNTDFGFEDDTQALVFQEVIDMTGNEAVHYYDYTSWGLVTDFRFGNELGRCFHGWNDLKWLYNFGLEWSLLPPNETVVYIENHDTERGSNNNILNYQTPNNYKMAIAYMLAWGYSQPKILSSFEFSFSDQGPPHDDSYNILTPYPVSGYTCSNGWVCQHRWPQIVNMVKFHNIVQGTDVTNWWDDGYNQMAFCKGNKGFMAFNLESSSALNEKLQTCLPQGTYCDVISGDLVNNACTGKSITVDSDGYAQISIDVFDTASTSEDGFVALHVEARVNCDLMSPSCKTA